VRMANDIRHVAQKVVGRCRRAGSGMSHAVLQKLHARLLPLAIAKMPLAASSPTTNRFGLPLNLRRVAQMLRFGDHFRQSADKCYRIALIPPFSLAGSRIMKRCGAKPVRRFNGAPGMHNHQG
jgi:hypothetical protein